MSNARNLANLLGTATTIQTSKIADDAITNAKLSDSDSFTVGGLTVSGASTFQGATTATSTTDGFGGDDAVLLNATDGSATDAGDHLVLNSSASGGTDDGENILFEDGTGDPNTLLNSNDTRLGGTINFLSKVKFDTATEGNSGGKDLLLDTTFTSSGGVIDISSTYINSTYDDYFLIFNLDPVDDGENLVMQVFIGGTIQTGNIYGSETKFIGSTNSQNNTNAGGEFTFNQVGIGGADGEGISGQLLFQNVNDPNHSFCYSGFVNLFSTAPNATGNIVAGSLINTQKASVVNGFRFFMSGGQSTGDFKLYGLRT